jgi:hypothetical protein
MKQVEPNEADACARHLENKKSSDPLFQSAGDGLV